MYLYASPDEINSQQQSLDINSLKMVRRSIKNLAAH